MYNNRLLFPFAQGHFRGLPSDLIKLVYLGFKEHNFPEIDYEEVDQVQGFTINFLAWLTKYRSDSIDKILNGMILFKFLRFPLNDCGYYEKYESFSEINQAWDKNTT
jgi:hypothetical protein